MFRIVATSVVPLVLLSSFVYAPVSLADEAALGDEDRHIQPIAPNISNQLLDPAGRSRFHLTGRASWSDATEAFTPSSLWTFEAQGAVRIFPGLAVTFLLPFGLEAPNNAQKSFFVGNFRVGAAGGHSFPLERNNVGVGAPRLNVGGAFDVYAPTAPELDIPNICRPRAFCNPVYSAIGLNSYEPELFLVKTMSFRLRAHADVRISFFTAELELGLTPAFTIESSSDFLMLFGVIGRLSSKPIAFVEPYLELGSSIHVVGTDLVDLSTPAMLTIGSRFHLLNSLDPALFMSISFKTGALIFGVDLAGVIRESTRRRDRDFLDTPDADF